MPSTKCQPDFKVLTNCGKCRVNIWKWMTIEMISKKADEFRKVAEAAAVESHLSKAEE